MGRHLSDKSAAVKWLLAALSLPPSRRLPLISETIKFTDISELNIEECVNLGQLSTLNLKIKNSQLG